jgi:hypothetical protein
VAGGPCVDGNLSKTTAGDHRNMRDDCRKLGKKDRLAEDYLGIYIAMVCSAEWGLLLWSCSLGTKSVLPFPFYFLDLTGLASSFLFRPVSSRGLTVLDGGRREKLVAPLCAPLFRQWRSVSEDFQVFKTALLSSDLKSLVFGAFGCHRQKLE